MSSTKRKLLRRAVVVNVGCGCRRPKISSIFSPKSKTKGCQYRKQDLYHSSSSSWEKGGLSVEGNDDDSTTTFSPTVDKDSEKSASRFGKIGESVAVVKESDDPYQDFRQSMLQMIFEKEIYAREDLRELLNCFLSLNSPYHHEIIVKAFMEIWNGAFSGPKPAVHRRRSRDFHEFTRGKGR